MATTKTSKKTALPRIHKKWYDFNIDPKTLRPIRFSWSLSSGYKEVLLYDAPDKDRIDIKDINLRNCIDSYYFVPDKTNKRIFFYPIRLVGHDTRRSCTTAHYEKLNVNVFYMFDENKQIWEICKHDYQKYMGYDYQNHQAIHETIKCGPRKVSRLSTYYYKIQCQSTDYIREMFAALYGNDFVYQNKLITDSDIRNNSWTWQSWLSTKGRKYSEKTVKQTDELMSKFSSQCRKISGGVKDSRYPHVTLETINGITAICYFSDNQETFRQIFNSKTGKLDNFIWKNDKWQKSGKLTSWQSIGAVDIKQSYEDTHEYDYKFLEEAKNHYIANQNSRGYWYSYDTNLYKFMKAYITNPVIHQLLQIQNQSSRNEFYQKLGNISEMYGKIPNRGKTMFAKLGINKYQFENPGVIMYVKWLLNTNNISNIDNQTWDKYSLAFAEEKSAQYRDKEIIDFLKSMGEFSVDRWIKICHLNKQTRTDTGYHYYSEPIKQLYKDYYSSLSVMSEFGIDISAYPLIFNDQQQLQRYHDEAARAVSNVRNKAQDEKFQMLYEKRLKMLEDDGKHMIGMPKCSADLTYEGSYLHHCVGGYVNSVANSNTAIYFLRKSSEPLTPWLTVEVRNKQCVQIHGSCNAWMGSKDEYFEAVPFLVWWFEKHGIEYSENLLTNMATGYCQSSNHRSMPTEAINAYQKQHQRKKSK